jgi:NADH-quinone oxidoreductase subunit J
MWPDMRMRSLIPNTALALGLVLALAGAVALALAPSVAHAQPNPVLQPVPGGQPGAAQPGQPGVVVQPMQPGARPVQPAQPGARPVQPAQPGGVLPPGARPAQPGAAPAGQPTAAAVKEDPRLNPKPPPHLDEIESTGKGTALLFWAFALATVGGALFVVTRRNLIAAVMGMVGSFLGISAVYMMLYASFLAVIQMLVYAGAIMVLFVFVVMILNRPEDEPVAPTGRVGQGIAVLAMLYLVFRLAMLLVSVKAPERAMGPPAPVQITINTNCDPARCEAAGGRCVTPSANQPPVCRVSHEWGTVRAVGTDLFGPGVFPFEAISILLLVGVVGAIAIARPLHEEGKTEAEAEAEAGAGGTS